MLSFFKIIFFLMCIHYIYDRSIIVSNYLWGLFFLLSVIAGVWIMQAALIDKYRKKISVRFLSAIVGAATFGFIMPVELQILLHRGAEYLEMGEPTTKSYVVTSTSDNVRGCGNEVLVEQLSSLSGRRICKAPDEIWDTLKRGDVIELSGIETDFGFRHESMSKLRK